MDIETIFISTSGNGYTLEILFLFGRCSWINSIIFTGLEMKENMKESHVLMLGLLKFFEATKKIHSTKKDKKDI